MRSFCSISTRNLWTGIFSRGHRKTRNVNLVSLPTSSGPTDHIDFSDNDVKGQICPEQKKILALESKLSIVQPLDHYHFPPECTAMSPSTILSAQSTCQPLSICSSSAEVPTSSSAINLEDSKGLSNFDKFSQRNGHMSIQRLKPLPHSMPTRNSLTAMPRPKRIILVRHGESEGNTQEILYTQIPDWKIALNPRGLRQAWDAGTKIKEIVKEEPVYVYHSPYQRAVQTCRQLIQALDYEQIQGLREEPRIAEQQFGNLQNLNTIRQNKHERSKFGRFFYRFPNGEAGLDVYIRVSGFIGTLRRDHLQEGSNVIIITHGLALRLFLMRWFQWSVEQFEATHNPPNCGIAVMERLPEDGRYRLTQETLDMIGAENAPKTSVIGRSFLGKAYVDTFMAY
uniref:Phosphoglycerate mutase n=2 Tax=Guillardia theta TaxID=55529 RepID=A0A7S4P656_GUITH|mmetsp:Transcript_4393/g.16029  ORF Transcript_4393/g.16029 Transcript_4393/m.16029 type:complete len:397 (+) Transcript_4393:48-1238(+)